MPDPSACGTIRDWMTREPVTVAVDCPIHVALGRMRSEAVRHLLVVDGDRLAGILSNRDVQRLLGDPPLGADAPPPLRLTDPVGRIMTEGPTTVAPETPVVVAARLLLETKIGALPVRDGDDIVGIFTSADALEALLAVVEGRGL
jgi:acetoin utilization protein AcuB